MSSVLIVDDETSVQEALRLILKDEHEAHVFPDGDSALRWIQENTAKDVDVVLLDILMPGTSGMDILREIKSSPDSPEVIMVTATKTVKTVVDAMKAGAFDYITKPFDVEEVKIVVDKALEKRRLVREVHYLRTEVARPYQPENLVGESAAMMEILKMVEQLAPSNSSVLIRGESGTGKEMVARALHFHPKGPRRNRAFVPIDCNTIPPNLLESELFGHEKGAFTGAEKKIGRFETADGGTLFLDEIGELPNEIQVKLLRFLDDRKFTRLGGTGTKELDVRVLAATNCNLEEAIEQGTFRDDLFYRLNVIPIQIPPLRERPEDIPLLADFFMEKYAKEIGIPPKQIEPVAMEALSRYAWPGNVREIRNVMERLTVLTPTPTIHQDHLPESILNSTPTNSSSTNGFEKLKEQIFEGRMTLESADDVFLKEIICDALRRANGVQTHAAELLSTSRRSLKYQMDKLGIRTEDFQAG